MGIGILIGVLIGLAIGFALSVWFDKMKTGDDTAKVKQMEGEHDAYRKQVDDHFVNTAVLFKGLTEQYRDVYQHIAQGAGELCSEEAKVLQTDLAETALLVQPSAVNTVDEKNDIAEPEPLNNDEVAEQESTVEQESTEEDGIPLASEVEMAPDIAEELKSQAAKKAE